MRTTLDLNEALLEKAMKASGETTKTAVIHKALTDLVRKNRSLKILDYAGKVDLPINLNKLRGRV